MNDTRATVRATITINNGLGTPGVCAGLERTPFRDPTSVALKLLSFCHDNGWAGYDPYDAINSRLLNWVPIINFRASRLALTQLLKWSPVNLRPLLLVPKTQNPKGLALCLMALLKLSRLRLLEDDSLVEKLTQLLVSLRSKSEANWCWGYSFPWQTRTMLVPKGAPNLVCTCFVGNALLDAYESGHDPRYLEMAVSAAKYIVEELYWTDGANGACFAYPIPTSRLRVHNANLLGSGLLCRVYSHSGDEGLLEPAFAVARYSCAMQHEDGSWYYGEGPKYHWADNFHTGFNLCALRSISQHTRTSEFDGHIRRGFEFYRDRFFRSDGAAKYFHDRVHPIDIHSAAQSIITLIAMKHLDDRNVELAHTVLTWTMEHMWDERGYFYYRVLPYYRNKIPYMRWSQAWMLLALTTILQNSRASEGVPETTAGVSR